MDAKNRLLIAVAITCLIVTALFASFGRNLFFIQFPSVSLAEIDDSSSSHTTSPEQEQELWRIDVTTDTVQSILATLNRPESYYRELSVETLWDGGSSTIYVQHWVDQDYSHIRQVLPSGVVRHDLSDLTTNYFWYEGNEQTFSIPIEEHQAVEIPVDTLGLACSPIVDLVPAEWITGYITPRGLIKAKTPQAMHELVETLAHDAHAVVSRISRR